MAWLGKIIALGLFVLAVYGLVGAMREVRRINRRLRAKLTPIGKARAGEPIALAGRVYAGAEGVMALPFRPDVDVVLFDIDILDVGGDTQDIVHTVHGNRPFVIEDDAGDRATIAPDDSALDLAETRYGDTERGPELTADGAVRTHMVMSDDVLRWAKPFISEDRVDCTAVSARHLAPGDWVYVFGIAERTPEGHLRLAKTATSELAISTGDRDHLARSKRLLLRSTGLSVLFLLALAATFLWLFNSA